MGLPLAPLGRLFRYWHSAFHFSRWSESAEQLRLFVEQAPVAIAMFDRDMRYLAASQRWNENFGLGKARLVGRSHYEVFPDIPERWKEAHRRGLAGETLREQQDRFDRDDGRLQWQRWELRPWRAANGSIGGIVIFSEDVTARVEAERALRESREDLDRAQAVARTGSWRLDVNRNQLTWSAETYRIFGIPSERPLTYESFLATVHPDDREHVDRSWKAALAGAPYDIEHRIVIEKETKWVRERAGLELDPAGGVLGGFGTVQDITDKKRVEEQLRESEARLRLSNEAAGIGIFTIDVEAGYTYYSPELASMLGFPLLRKAKIEDTFARVHRDDLSRVRTQYEEGLSGADAGQIKVDFRFVRPGGEIRWMTCAGRVDFREGLREPVPFRVAGACVDITERMRAEERVRESEERFRGIFKHAGTGIAMLDLHGRFESCNPAYSAMVGFTEDELRGLDFRDLVHPDDREANMAANRRLVAQEIPSFEISIRFVGKDGKPIWVHKHVSLLRNAAGTPTSIIALVTNITERKRHEERIGLLMREVNHRSKNMLALVQAVARQTLATEPDDFVARFEERIQALAASQDLLVKNEWRGVDLDELVCSQLAHFRDLTGTRIRLTGRKFQISAPAAQAIGMALHELATNAGKYGALSTEDGRVEIGWNIKQGEAGEETFVIGWREQSVHPIATPSRHGFGSTVICGMAEMSLGAKVELHFPVTGLTWRLECPARKVLCSSYAVDESTWPARGNALTSARPRVW